MIGVLRDQGLLSVVESDGGLIGYCFVGRLYEAYALLDELLVRVLSRHWPAEPHSCPPLLNRSVLERIGFFEKLPSIPFHVVPHKMADRGPASDQWLLSPSTCYHTFSLLSGIDQHWPLKCFTATSNCHRFEPEGGDPLRMASFTMREFVFMGEREAVEQESEAAFLHSVEFLRRAGFSIDIEVASDIFYGEGSAATRKVQKALGVKLEALTTGPTGRQVSVASRNFHRDLFTSTFDIGDASRPQRMYSACVAFGVERLLLSLLAATPGFDPSALVDALRLSAEHYNTEREPA